MLSSKPFDQLFDWVAKTLVCDNLRGPAGVTASRWHFQQSQNGDTWWLVLVADVAVVASSAEPTRACLCTIQVVGTKVDVVKLNVVLDVRSNGLTAVSISGFTKVSEMLT
jgi:hypothetical protein